MKDKPTTEPLRGDAAWRAEKKAIAQRNDAARAAGVRERAAKDAKSISETAELARREMQRLHDRQGG